jgi:hypothetical protein
MNRLLDPTGTLTFEVSAVLAGKRAGGAALFPQIATEKGKGQKIGSPTCAKLQTAPWGPSAPAANAETPVPTQSGDIQTGRLAGEDLPIPTLGETQGSRAPAQPLALQNFLATGITPGHSANSVSVSTASEVAFALQLTWQPAAIVSGALAAQAGSEGALLGKTGPGDSNGVLRPADQPAGLSASGDNTNEDPEFLRGVCRASSNSLPRSAAAGFTGLDSMIREEAGSRSPEMLAVIRPWNVSTGSSPRNRGEASSWEASGWEGSGLPPEIDSQGLGPARAPALVPERATPEPGVAEASQCSPAPETPVHTEPETPMAGPEEYRMAESGTSRRLPGVAGATQSETALNDSQNPTGRSAENSESDGQSPRVLPTEKLSLIQFSHEHAGLAADGVLLGRPTELSGAPQTRTKIAAPQPPQAPMALPEVETASAVPAQPIREISLRLAGAASAQVDVQVTERAGRVQVAVRTADPDLATSLQNNLGDLMGRLEEKGFRTEAWTPATAQHSGGAVRETSTSAKSQSQSDDSGFSGGRQNSQHGQRESNQRQPGRWKAQLNETISALNTRTYGGGKP